MFWHLQLCSVSFAGLPCGAGQMCSGGGAQASCRVLQPQGHFPYVSFEGITDPHPHPGRHHPNRISTLLTPATELWPQHQSGKLRERKGRMPCDFGQRTEEKIFLNVMLPIYFPSPLLSKCLHKKGAMETVGFFYFLCSVWIQHFSLGVQIDHPAVSASWIQADCFFPHSFYAWRPIPQRWSQRLDAHLLFLTDHEIQHLLPKCFPRHIIFKDVLLIVQYVTIKIRLLNLNKIKFRYYRWITRRRDAAFRPSIIYIYT